MCKIGWRFPPLAGGQRQGYTNNDIEGYKGQNLIDNFAREICQNSLDAHLENKEDPVKVVFELRKVRRQDFEVFSQYKKCLEGCREYWKDDMDDKLDNFLVRAENTLEKDEIAILVASDFNTKGLSGCHSRKKSSPWEALTGSDGISVKSDKTSAGSYGIGKNAPFACSSLSMVFYNTLTEDGERAFIGVARLATLYDKGEETQRVGRYQVNDDEHRIWNPIYQDDMDPFRDIFTRNISGTDVITVGFSQQEKWLPNVKKAVLKNFFVAIRENRLIVELIDGSEHETLNEDTISEKLAGLENDQEMIYTIQLYEAFTNPQENKTFEVLEPDDVEVRIRADANYKRIIANFRATGMLIKTYYRKILQHYAAVVIIRGEELGKLLRDTEPARHDEWDYTRIDNVERKKKARTAIMTIREKVFNLLKSQFEVDIKKTVDPEGVGKFLPDEADGMEDQTEGSDILKPKIKIGKIRTDVIPQGKTMRNAIRGEGTENPGEVRNKTRRPNPTRKKPPIPVDIDPDNPNPQSGATPGKGSKIVITPSYSALRAVPVKSERGLYRIVIKPNEDYNNLFVECFAEGEDGRPDPLEMTSFTNDGTSVRVSEGKAGPVKVKANTPAILFATFRRHEKMKLRLRLTAEVKK